MPDPLPLRLHRAVSILSRIGSPEATEAQVAIAETAARIVRLEEVLIQLLEGVTGAEQKARGVLADG